MITEEEKQKLVYEAKNALSLCYPKDSQHLYAAAVLTEKRNIIAVASNEENKQGEFTAPCHMCKQLLWESTIRSSVPLLIILSNEHGEIKEVFIDELMPLPWPKKI